MAYDWLVAVLPANQGPGLKTESDERNQLSVLFKTLYYTMYIVV